MAACVAVALFGCRETPKAYDANGEPVDVFAGGSETTVLTFVSVDCPISNRYVPELEKLRQTHGEVSFWHVYPNAKETPEAIARHRSEYDITIPFVRDPEHALVALAGATVTPEAAVFDSDKKQRYRGRIDDRYVAFGKYRPQASRHDLSLALSKPTDGLTTTKAIGCAIVKPAAR